LAVSGRAAELPPSTPVSEKIEIAPGPFQPTEPSLKQYRYPDWFRDAKLGIWAVWGPESVPQQGDWYAHRLYDPKDAAYKYHVEHYGHPSTFGFKDIIPLWKAENWNPDRLMGLYKRAGAKYFCMIAEHHDNFDCWNSKHQKWNSVNMGPRRDIAGEWQKAAREHGLRFGMTEHLAASWWFYSVAKGADKTGPLAGVRYDGADPRYADLYWTGNEQPKENYYCPHGPAYIKQAWFDRIQDMIDRYHPDLLYSDSPLPYPDEFGRKLLAHYYNDSARQHAGRVEAVYNCKQNSQGMWVQDLERGVMDKICPTPWQTDTCVGGWYYDVNLAKRHGYKSTATVIQMLADIVSKNGNLLLNFPPRPDGTLDDDELKILDEMAAWMPINGEAIFGTRPWKVFGEGARKLKGGMFNENNLRYTASDIRFTTKGPAIYALALGWPTDGKLLVRSLAKAAGKIDSVGLLGSSEPIIWSQQDDGLAVTLPKQKPCKHVFVLKIAGGADLEPAPLPPPNPLDASTDGRFLLKAVDADLHGDSPKYVKDWEKDQIGFWGEPRRSPGGPGCL
jgi:alpha-L-fucosidase